MEVFTTFSNISISYRRKCVSLDLAKSFWVGVDTRLFSTAFYGQQRAI